MDRKRRGISVIATVRVMMMIYLTIAVGAGRGHEVRRFLPPPAPRLLHNCGRLLQAPPICSARAPDGGGRGDSQSSQGSAEGRAHVTRPPPRRPPSRQPPPRTRPSP
eukprot:COSAG01_NODE_385_length_17743_cov_20.528622_1_plen_106_part_10